jgi:hypothetical protein
MNPVVYSMLFSLVRYGVMFGAGWLVNHGVWAHADADKYVTEITIGILAALAALASMAWAKIKQKRLLNAAIALPKGSTVEQARRVVKEGMAPPASLPENAIPFLAPPKVSPVKPPDAAA